MSAKFRSLGNGRSLIRDLGLRVITEAFVAVMPLRKWLYLVM